MRSPPPKSVRRIAVAGRRLLGVLVLGVFVGVAGLGPWTVVQAQPDSVATQFERANAAYQQGRYEQAVAQYQQILADGHASGVLYYNLANAYVRRDQLGQAIRYYEKARPLLGADPRLEHSLEQARRRAGVYPGTLPPRGLQGVVAGWPVRLLFVAGLLLVGTGLGIAVTRTAPDRELPCRWPAVWGPVLAGSLGLIVAFGASALQDTAPRAVVIADRATVHDTPDASVSPDTTLLEGTLLEVQARRDEWAAVRGGDGTTGWVPIRALGDV
jgi:hypothetical protein